MKILYSKNGFTLVELAIVMMIIGLLIGGVLQGQTLLENARVNQQIKQFEAINGATLMFRERYATWPGDLPTATARLTGCTAGNYCGNGNGDGIIGRRDMAFMAPSQHQVQSLPELETTFFWKHLALSDLLSGVVPSANTTTTIPGETHPISPLGGMLFIGYNSGVTGDPNVPHNGHFLLISRGESLETANAVVPVRMAMRLDRLLDDEMPNTGTIVAETIASGCKDSEGPAGIYLTAGMASSGAIGACFIWYQTNF